MWEYGSWWDSGLEGEGVVSGSRQRWSVCAASCAASSVEAGGWAARDLTRERAA